MRWAPALATARERGVDAGYQRLIRPTLFGSYGGDAERVHEHTLRVLARLAQSRPALRTVAALCGGERHPVTVAGIQFPGLVGLAAGMDKDGVGAAAWSALGFGHVELGTVTAGPQPGNERPRLFRLPASQGLINRMGFNNAGAEALAQRLRAAGVRRGNGAVGMPLGVSIGKTKITALADATSDYLSSLRVLAPYADYVAVNVSSPNTPGLRSLQDKAALSELVNALVTESSRLEADIPVPILVKIAPDLTPSALDEVLEVCLNAGVRGLIAANTTLSRAGLAAADQQCAVQSGGLSGAPLTVRAREVVRYLSAYSTLPVIGVGGILTAADGRAMLDAGASLLQVYTGFVYRGPALLAELNRLSPGKPVEVR